MSLSKKAKEVLIVAVANKSVGEEIATAIDAGSNDQAATVAAIGVTADVSAAALSTTNTYTDLAVNAELDSLIGEIEARTDVIEAKIDELIAALKAAGIMA